VRTNARSLIQVEPFDERNFARLTKFIYDRCGILITDKKRTMLEARLRRRMQATGTESGNDYCRLLLDGEGVEIEEEIALLIDAVTVNKTDFFRETVHFDRLLSTILPTLAKKGKRFFKAWSAACSNGAEPYSIAMVLDEFCRSLTGADYFVLATDICTAVLDRAVSGRYPATAVEPIPLGYRHRHLMIAKDRRRREFRIAPHLRVKMAFAQINLIAPRYPIAADYDVVFCRNVLIYFDRPTQERVLSHLIGHLQPEGYLVLGHSESLVGIDLPLVAVGNTIFRRR
jgi:chemotaxis protein methyltransferase CheR